LCGKDLATGKNYTADDVVCVKSRDEMQKAWHDHVNGAAVDGACGVCVLGRARILADFARAVGVHLPLKSLCTVHEKQLRVEEKKHAEGCRDRVVTISSELKARPSLECPTEGAITLVTVVFDREVEAYRYQVMHYAGHGPSEAHSVFIHARGKVHDHGLVQVVETKPSSGFLQCLCAPDAEPTKTSKTPLMLAGYPYGVKQAASSSIQRPVSDLKSDPTSLRLLDSVSDQVMEAMDTRGGGQNIVEMLNPPAQVTFTTDEGEEARAALALCRVTGDRAAAAMQLGAATIGCKNRMYRGNSREFRVVVALELFGVHFTGHKLVGFVSRYRTSPQFISCISSFTPFDPPADAPRLSTPVNKYRGVGAALVRAAIDHAGPSSLLVPECPMSAEGCHLFAKVFADRLKEAEPAEGKDMRVLAAKTRVPLHFVGCLARHTGQRMSRQEPPLASLRLQL
jgi:hypothetical protein